MSVGFSGIENEDRPRRSAGASAKNERPGVVAIRTDRKIYVPAGCLFWAAAASSFCDSALGSTDRAGTKKRRKGTQPIGRLEW